MHYFDEFYMMVNKCARYNFAKNAKGNVEFCDIFEILNRGKYYVKSTLGAQKSEQKDKY